MTKVKIVTDGVASLSSKIAEEMDITIVPFLISFGDKDYRDGIDIHPGEFYKMLRQAKSLPATSVPSFGDIKKVYSKLSQETDKIVSLHTSPKFSKMFEMALKAAEEFPNVQIEVVNLKTPLDAEALIVLEAAMIAKQGGSIKDIMKRIEEITPFIDNVIVLDTLEYLHSGGRIGKVQALMGSLLKIKYLMTIKNEEPLPLGRVRSFSRARRWIIDKIKLDLMRWKATKGRCIISHADNEREAFELKKELQKYFNLEKIFVTDTPLTMATHLGPGAFSVAYYLF